MRGKRFSIGLRALAIFAVTLSVTSTWAATNWNEKVLHSFSIFYTGGDRSSAGLISDAAGNLYGTTVFGGTYSCSCGTVFELTPDGSGGWTETVLYSFNGTDGGYPQAGLIFDARGNLYGTTYGDGYYGPGTAFELSPNQDGGWTETVLHTFGNGTDGAAPYAGLIFDAAGNLYGTTTAGGTYNSCLYSANYCGTVFELTPTVGGGWTEQVLHSFNGTDGAVPYAGLVFDAAGNLYGTTDVGGTDDAGTVFELTPAAGGGWTETVLYSFCAQPNCTDGGNPSASLILDAAGNLYGTTDYGGTYCPQGCGTVFELTPAGRETVLYSFCAQPNCTDGAYPSASLIFDAAGNLYGTTRGGGTYGYGTVFELTPEANGGWMENVLHSFNDNGTDGSTPEAGLIFDAAGNLYGTTQYGGVYYNGGTVFELTPLYPCAVCSHSADRELNVLPVEKRDARERGGIERP